MNKTEQAVARLKIVIKSPDAFTFSAAYLRDDLRTAIDVLDEHDDSREKLLRTAVDTYGQQSQVFMAIEEMAELTKALSKCYRKSGPEQLYNILEEIADVRIMIDQLQLIFEPMAENFSVSLCEESKLERLANRLGVQYKETT